MKKKDGRHSIPKEEQIPQTPANQRCMVLSFLEGRAYNPTTNDTGTLTKRQRNKHLMEGKAVETKVLRLFAGGATHKKNGPFILELPKFDNLQINRTGKRPIGRNEWRAFRIAIKHNLPIVVLSLLTGRDEKDVQLIIDGITGKNKPTLFKKRKPK